MDLLQNHGINVADIKKLKSAGTIYARKRYSQEIYSVYNKLYLDPAVKRGRKLGVNRFYFLVYFFFPSFFSVGDFSLEVQKGSSSLSRPL